MDILKIETFLAIVKLKSISKAADSLFVSQATVSQRLNSLEEIVGFPLIERSKGARSIELTPHGERFVHIAHKWMDLFNDMKSQMAAERKLRLSVGYTESMIIHLFAPFYRSLINNENSTQFDLVLRTERSTEIHKMIVGRELDVGFVYSLHPDSNILTVPLFSEPLVVISLSNYGDGKAGLHPSQLDERHEIYTKWSVDFQAWHQNNWSSSISPYMTLDSEYTIVDYLDPDGLWAIVPTSVAILSKKQNPNIMIYDLLGKPPSRICYKITHRLPRESRKNTLEIFSKLMADFIRSHTDLSLFD